MFWKILWERLLTTLRDSLGLTYNGSFELNLFDRLSLRWYVISVTSTPGKVYKAVDACKNVLRGLQSIKISPRELDRAKRTLLIRHEAETKQNAYWVGLLAHLQAFLFQERKHKLCPRSEPNPTSFRENASATIAPSTSTLLLILEGCL
ncbi:hypothetical protein MKX01_018247 [Papaver californicum]|nr:hypothetical protein MKX01_018247 [Papaver californicum]